MSIEAVALLRLPDLAPAPGDTAPADVIVLADAVLVRTGATFAAEPHELAAGLRRMLGDRLDAHADARGVFFVPGAAREPARSAGAYAAVIEAIGEAGMWVALVEDVSTARPTMVEALMTRAMDGEEIDPETMQGAMRASLAQMAEAFAGGDEENEIEGEGTNPGTQGPMDLGALLSDPTMRALVEKMRDLVPARGTADAELDESADDDDDDDDDSDDATDGSGTELDGTLPAELQALLGSPAFAEMLANARDILEKNPDEARKIAERLGLEMGAGGDDEE